MSERIELDEARRDIEEAFHQWGRWDAEEPVKSQARVNAFLAQVEAEAAQLSRAKRVLRMAYRKHHLGDESIGWNELSDELAGVLCETMGDKEFQAWAKNPITKPY